MVCQAKWPTTWSLIWLSSWISQYTSKSYTCPLPASSVHSLRLIHSSLQIRTNFSPSERSQGSYKPFWPWLPQGGWRTLTSPLYGSQYAAMTSGRDWISFFVLSSYPCPQSLWLPWSLPPLVSIDLWILHSHSPRVQLDLLPWDEGPVRPHSRMNQRITLAFWTCKAERQIQTWLDP